jgi:hypothetical protein
MEEEEDDIYGSGAEGRSRTAGQIGGAQLKDERMDDTQDDNEDEEDEEEESESVGLRAPV